MNIAKASDAELYAELHRIDGIPCNDEATEEALMRRAERIEQELVARAQRAGRCCHTSSVGYRDPPFYPEQEGLRPGELCCTSGCGRVFASDRDWYIAINDAINAELR